MLLLRHQQQTKGDNMTKYQQRQLKRDLYRALPAFVTGLVMLGFVFLSMVIFTLNQG